MDRSKRLVLLLAALSPIMLTLIKGHDPVTKDGIVAFLPYSTQGVTVKISGEVQSRGVYRFSSWAEINTVINMTDSEGLSRKVDYDLLHARLHDGDSMDISRLTLQHTELTINSMKTR